MSAIAGKVQVITQNFRGYSGVQRAAFTGILAGFFLCGIGAIPPYWKTGSISLEIPIGDIEMKLLDMHAGLWTFCLKVVGTEEKCDSTNKINELLSDFKEALLIKDDGNKWLITVIAAAGWCVFLALVSGCAACCRFCCCAGGKTVCHGITSFLAGGLGLAATIIFVVKDIYGLPIINASYGWSFYMFSAGAGILVISSFLLCFATPRENVYHLMTTDTNAPSVIVQTSSSNTVNMTPATQFQNPIQQPSGAGQFGQNPNQFVKY